MKRPRGFLRLFDAERLVRRSDIRLGGLRIRGVPAILIGVACVVGVARFGRAVERTAPMLPEALRETRALWRTARGERAELHP